MTQHDYIVATDRRTVELLLDVLKTLQPNTSHCPDRERIAMARTLNRWYDRLCRETDRLMRDGAGDGDGEEE